MSDDDTTITSATPVGPTGAQVASAIAAVNPALAALAAIMASSQYAEVIVVSEDIEQALASLGVPGAAAVETAEQTAVAIAPTALADAQAWWPTLAPIVDDFIAGGAAAPTGIVRGRRGGVGES